MMAAGARPSRLLNERLGRAGPGRDLAHVPKVLGSSEYENGQ